MEDNKLSKNDLFILMESYKNNIQLNTTLLEQQKQLIVMINQSVDKQKELCENLDEFIKNLTNCSERMNNNHLQIITKIGEASSRMSSEVSEVSKKITIASATTSVENSKITNKIYVSLVGMVTVVVSIIGLAITYTQKFSYLADLITKHIGVK